jgi:predicted transcriptional regulator
MTRKSISQETEKIREIVGILKRIEQKKITPTNICSHRKGRHLLNFWLETLLTLKFIRKSRRGGVGTVLIFKLTTLGEKFLEKHEKVKK